MGALAYEVQHRVIADSWIWITAYDVEEQKQTRTAWLPKGVADHAKPRMRGILMANARAGITLEPNASSMRAE